MSEDTKVAEEENAADVVAQPYDPSAFQQSEAVRATNTYGRVLDLLPGMERIHTGGYKSIAPYPEDVMKAIDGLVQSTRDWVSRASPSPGRPAELYPGVLPE